MKPVAPVTKILVMNKSFFNTLKIFDCFYIVIGASNIHPIAIEGFYINCLFCLEQIEHQIVKSIKFTFGYVAQDIAAEHINTHTDFISGRCFLLEALKLAIIIGLQYSIINM